MSTQTCSLLQNENAWTSSGCPRSEELVCVWWWFNSMSSGRSTIVNILPQWNNNECMRQHFLTTLHFFLFKFFLLCILFIDFVLFFSKWGLWCCCCFVWILGIFYVCEQRIVEWWWKHMVKVCLSVCCFCCVCCVVSNFSLFRSQTIPIVLVFHFFLSHWFVVFTVCVLFLWMKCECEYLRTVENWQYSRIFHLCRCASFCKLCRLWSDSWNLHSFTFNTFNVSYGILVVYFCIDEVPVDFVLKINSFVVSLENQNGWPLQFISHSQIFKNLVSYSSWTKYTQCLCWTTQGRTFCWSLFLWFTIESSR